MSLLTFDVGRESRLALESTPPVRSLREPRDVASQHRRTAPSRLTLFARSRVQLSGATPKGCHHGGGPIRKGSTEQRL
jgi:hypothetical protein